ncbi:MAG: biotin transporter BioY, partial [Firmicutes bacterium]|nr:biotin transporter BioY [Bacillota bacterium]
MNTNKDEKVKTVASNRLDTGDLALVALFAAVMAVCSWITVPAAVPFTLQTMGVFLAVGLLGGKRGTISVLVYLFLGAIGLPVFSGFAGGLGYMMGATGGYIIGFLFSALIMWFMEK